MERTPHGPHREAYNPRMNQGKGAEDEYMTRPQREARAAGAKWFGGAAGSATERDVQLAATSHVPVLISGEPGASLELASELSRRSGARSAVVLVDCRHGAAAERIVPAMCGPSARTDAGLMNALLLLEVQALSSTGQVLLEQQLETTLLDGGRTRVIASSSVPLYERVATGEFRERLYYFLNMIHLVARTEGGG
jgi:DNA-binding NtrC family response regulator